MILFYLSVNYYITLRFYQTRENKRFRHTRSLISQTRTLFSNPYHYHGDILLYLILLSCHSKQKYAHRLDMGSGTEYQSCQKHRAFFALSKKQ